MCCRRSLPGTVGSVREVSPDPDDPLLALASLPRVGESVAAARQACEELRWHQAMRRRSAETRAEAVVRAARCSAALDGARLSVELVRDASRGARALPDDGAGRLVRGAVRALAAAEHLSAGGGHPLTSAPWQALARLHVASCADLLPDDAVGRPRGRGEPPLDSQGPAGSLPAPEPAELSSRLEALSSLLSRPTDAPVLVVAAIAQAEVLVLRPFLAGNGVVSRALARALVVGRGLDPTGAAVPEASQLSDPGALGSALAGYATGTADGVAGWIAYCARTIVEGAAEGRAVADAVVAGRLPAS